MYQNGKIYKLWCMETDLIYIGSTCNHLYKRLSEHKKKTNTCNSKKLFELSNNVKIELIEEYACNNKMELNRKEGEHIRLNKEKCINKIIAGRTKKEYYEKNKDEIILKNKEYYEKNKEKYKEYNKEYQLNNKDKLKKYYQNNNKDKEYYEKNKDKIKLRKKEYYEKNKEMILQKLREKRNNKKIEINNIK